MDDVFPGWQWRPVNPITYREEGEFQPFNTTIPSCSKLYGVRNRIQIKSVICSLNFVLNLFNIMNFDKYDIYYIQFNINLSKGLLLFLPKLSFWVLTWTEWRIKNWYFWITDEPKRDWQNNYDGEDLMSQVILTRRWCYQGSESRWSNQRPVSKSCDRSPPIRVQRRGEHYS